jgi:ABC-type transport system involved in multi-copper enzyme maturation permease subunit
MFSFLRQLLGPIFAKEMVEAGRQKRTYVLRFLLGAALLLAFVFSYANMMTAYGNNDRPSAQSRRATELAAVVLTLQYAAVWLVVPAAVCGALAGERERGSLELLFTTHLRSAEIVAGKAGARLALAAFLLLIPYPCLALLASMGGVDFVYALWMELAALLAALICGGVAMYWSSRSQTPLRAAIMTYITLVVALLGLPLLALFVNAAAHGFRGSPQGWFFALVFVNPFFFLSAVEGPMLDRTFASALGENYRYWALAGHGAVFLALCWAAAKRLRQPVGKAPGEAARGFRRFLPAWPGAGKPWRLHPEKVIFLFGEVTVRNPMWLRARQAPVYDRERALVAFRRLQICYYAVVALCSLYVIAAHGMPGRNGFGELMVLVAGLGWIFSVLPLALAPALAANGDRRRGFLDQALTTTLEPAEVFDGTVRGVYEHVRGLLLWGVAPLALGVAFMQLQPLYAAMTALLYLMSARTIVVGVTALSFAARSAAGAVGMGFLFALSAILGGGAWLAAGLRSNELVRLALAAVVVIGVLIMLATRRWRTAAQASMFSLALLATLYAIPLWKLAGADRPDRNLELAATAVSWLFSGMEIAARGFDGYQNGYRRNAFADGIGYWLLHMALLWAAAQTIRRCLLANFDRVVRRSE